jgi:hypothetical protein
MLGPTVLRTPDQTVRVPTVPTRLTNRLNGMEEVGQMLERWHSGPPDDERDAVDVQPREIP